MATRALNSAKALSRRLRYLHKKRRRGQEERREIRDARKALTRSQRDAVLAKTGGRCHICGGHIKKNARWAADHILAYAHGGPHDVSNYLPAHGPCNRIRKDYRPEEFRWILRLGVWFRGRIAGENARALELAERFCVRERRKETRRGVRKPRE